MTVPGTDAAPGDPTTAFRQARDVLLTHHDDHERACREFSWPRLTAFNWALDWFDVVARTPERRDATALHVMDLAAGTGGDTSLTYAEMSERSGQVATWLAELGVRRGDPLLLMLDNRVDLWITLLAALKLGAVVVPATTLLGEDDLSVRMRQAGVRHVVTRAADTPKFRRIPGIRTRIVSLSATDGRAPEGWHDLATAPRVGSAFRPEGTTLATDPLFRYFTSGTTSRPKLVQHSHASYPVGQLTTMYLVGQRSGDTHTTIAQPGWAKHACSMVFAPWSAEAGVLALAQPRFDVEATLDALVRGEVTTFCAPPTVWRMIVQQPLDRWKVSLREAVSAGEPLNAEIIERIRRAWGVTVRDGYGQTEATGLVGNPPGLPVKPGAMGRPLPGYRVELLGPDGLPAEEGEICLDVTERPLGLLTGYADDEGQPLDPCAGRWYRTGDVAQRDVDGYYTYVGRQDDVFKSSDYRISPFQLESVLLQHESVAEAAVVPAADERRLAVPKAYVTLAATAEPSRETATELFTFLSTRLAPYQRIRRIEFAELPKNSSGKIERSVLKAFETSSGQRRDTEFREEDLLNRRLPQQDSSPVVPN
ncbi:AMP-binding protein [Streptomyces sp. KMM 9044]|uniref:AMP-binding protein n=1 Tax=Streptomyces sp. KMM 9044 TaxID=2744474 RepID=UPI00215145D0|nr:AMP-binding protein [Streptomyces sp. KMM 9044]WAX80940.1 AMP-binding protein [Streptomyces sp. KMM 9044]